MTSRRRFLLASSLAALAPAPAFAQSRPVRIGMLAPRALKDSILSPHIVRRLEQLGYRQGAGMMLEYRVANAAADYPKLAQELAQRDCDVLIAVGTEPAVKSLKDARPKAPIVFLAINYDPVSAGVVSSFRTPGAGLTGVYLQTDSVAAKRLDFIREVLPSARRIAVLSDEYTREQLAAMRNAAPKGGVTLLVQQFDKAPYDLAAALERSKKEGAEALVVLGSPVLAGRSDEIGRLATLHRLPGIGTTQNAEAGLLLAYFANNVKAATRAADMVARILKGAKPSDMPVEQADEFELIINVRTAKTLGLKLPFSLLAQATRVIE